MAGQADHVEGDLRRRAAERLRGILPDARIAHFLADFYDGEVFEDALRYLGERRILGPGRLVVDVGCGFGAFALGARALGSRVLGLDLGEEEVSIAHRRVSTTNGVVILRADALALPVRSESVDLVVYLHVLEHVSSVERALNDGVRALRRGGSLYVVAPNYAAVFWEPHYHVPWLPLLPRGVGSRYLRALGRDPRVLAELTYTTWSSIVETLRRLGLLLDFPRMRKLDRPQAIRRPAVRSAVRLLRQLGALGLVRRFATWPLQGNVEVLARKP